MYARYIVKQTCNPTRKVPEFCMNIWYRAIELSLKERFLPYWPGHEGFIC